MAGVGYLLKDRVMDVSQFVDTVRRVAAGGTAAVMDPEVISQLLAKLGKRRADRPGSLPASARRGYWRSWPRSGRRRERQVAVQLFVSEKAVSKHIANIFMKLDLGPSEDDNRRVRAVLTYLDA